MDETSRKIVARAAKNHAQYNAMGLGDFATSASETETTDSEMTETDTEGMNSTIGTTNTTTSSGKNGFIERAVGAAEESASDSQMRDEAYGTDDEEGTTNSSAAPPIPVPVDASLGQSDNDERNSVQRDEAYEDAPEAVEQQNVKQRDEAYEEEPASSQRDEAYDDKDPPQQRDEAYEEQPAQENQHEKRETVKQRDEAYEDDDAPAQPQKQQKQEKAKQRDEAYEDNEPAQTQKRQEKHRDEAYEEEHLERTSSEHSTQRDRAYEEDNDQTRDEPYQEDEGDSRKRDEPYQEDENEQKPRDEPYQEDQDSEHKSRDVAYDEDGSTSESSRRDEPYNEDDLRRRRANDFPYSEDDEHESEYSSDGGFDASEESYGGQHFFEGHGSVSKTSSEYDTLASSSFGRRRNGFRRDQPYENFAGGRSETSSSIAMRDETYDSNSRDGGAGTSSVAGSSDAYVAMAMTNETKTTESRTSGLTPIQRAAKRAMERDSPYVPLNDLIPQYEENPEGLKKALNTPVPYDHGVIQCTLRISKKLLYFYLQPDNRLLMIGLDRDKMFSRGLNCMISVVPRGKRHEPSFIGKVRSNANFTKFWVYDGGLAPKNIGVNKNDPTPPRKELAYIKYDLFPDAPRYMLVMTPRVKDDESWVDFIPHLPRSRDEDDGSMEARHKNGQAQDIEVSYNRKPEWNSKLGRFELDCKNRAQLPSTKNFMISTRLDPNHDSVLMGKAADKTFTISVQYPMTLFQGLCISISAIYARTYK